MEDFNLSAAKAAVHDIVTKLETNFKGFNISEIWKAGSLGHGTVVPGHYDIDLVIYSRDIIPAEVISCGGFGHWISLLERFLVEKLNIRSVGSGGYQRRSLQFIIYPCGVKLKVDLLVSPYWTNPREFYMFLERIPSDKREIFTVCASKWQIQFFNRVEPLAKEYIRQVKAKRNRTWASDEIGRPSSYLISLLVWKAYELAKHHYRTCHPEFVQVATMGVLILVMNPLLDVIYWEEFYKLEDYKHLLPAPPRIIDPANPANNVLESGIKGEVSSTMNLQQPPPMLYSSETVERVRISTAKEAIDIIVNYIKTEFRGFNVSEVIKAGSLGDGTAVPGDYDIDLVVYSRSFTAIDVKMSGAMFQPWISQLKRFIQHFPGVRMQNRGQRGDWFSVEFSYQVSPGVILEVDLLVSPYWDTPRDFYEFIKTVKDDDRIFYSVCASKWQRAFFNKQDNKVKEYIRRAKAWRNKQWGIRRSLDGKPKSYLMSLLVVRAYETVHSDNPHSVTHALKALVKSENKDVYWADGPGDFYRRCDYPNLLPPRPRIIDPANPCNNVWKTGIIGGNPHLLMSLIASIDLSQPIS